MVIMNYSGIYDIFQQIQYNRTSHESNMKKLRKIYKRANFDEFCKHFNQSLTVPWLINDDHPHIDNVFIFAANFSVSAHKVQDNNSSTDEETMCPFLEQTFDFTLKYSCAKGATMRYRTCQFINVLLKSMGNDSFIDDSMCDKITRFMTDRLMDKSSKVRTQAVFALHRLQDPSNTHCPIIKMYIFHLMHDPYPKVRQAVLSCIGKNIKTLHAVLTRTRDMNVIVRKMAYKFISKITVKSLTIAQRETLLDDGLKDRNTAVSETVKNVLLPSWLEHFQGDYIKLLRGLDAETSTEIVVLALNVLLKQDEVSNLLKHVPSDPETKLVPFDKLSGEVALFWRCLIQHLYRESLAHEEDMCIPELSKLCQHIREYLATLDSNGSDTNTSKRFTQSFVLLQLIEIAKTYDLGDEFGRTNLKNLLLDILLSEHCSGKVTESIVKYLEIVIPDVETRLDCLARVIGDLTLLSENLVPVEISEEEQRKKKLEIAKLRVKLNEIQEEEYTAIRNRDFLKAQSLKEEIEVIAKAIEDMAAPVPVIIKVVENDNENITAKTLKCLEIICAMAAANSIKTLTPVLRNHFEDLVLPSLEHENDEIHIMALKGMAICCLLDGELAKKHIMMYFLLFSVELDNRRIWIIALQAIFDLFVCYGLEFFDIDQHNDDIDNTETKNKTHGSTRLLSNTDDDLTAVTVETEGNAEGNGNFIKILIGLLDNGDQEIRTLTTEGLCKLFLHNRITGPYVLTRLIILMYNPVNKDDVYMCQCLCNFFREFVIHVSDSGEMLEQTFLPTLKMLANAPDASPLQAIDPYDVAKFILSLTRNRGDKPGTESFTAHNNLAFVILSEALHPMSEIDQEVLLKSLKDLDIRFEDDTFRDNLHQAADKICDTIPKSSKRLISYIKEFKLKIDARNRRDEATMESREDEESVNVDE